MCTDKLKKQRGNLRQRSLGTLNHMRDIADESRRVEEIARYSPKRLEEIENEFEIQTGLNKTDIIFLFAATALQCVRQYILTGFEERVDDKTAAKKTNSGVEEHSNRTYRWYNPSLNDILLNPVPFDTNFGSPDFNLKLGGGFTHRAKTLGHDPLLGWIFGTANIATGTLTTWDLRSFHIKTGFTKNDFARDKIAYNASTSKVLYYTKNKLLDSGTEGKKIIGASILKEAIHLRSDIGSFASLPIPVVSSISPELSKDIADYGIDMANIAAITKQAAFAMLINALVAMIHKLFYDQTISKTLYEVKTRKILSYSNLIAATSNVIAVAIGTSLGNGTAIRKLDIGGFAVTIYRLIKDFNFIYKVKEEFIFSSFNKLIDGSTQET